MSHEKLIDRVRELRSQHKSKEDIYLSLLRDDFKVNEIESAFKKASSGSAEDSQKRTIQIIVTIGAILIGAGVFSFLASNWDEIGNLLKLSIIIFFMLLAYFSGWYLDQNRGYHKTGGALILLGTIIYGAGIFLVAQMYNIRTSWPDGFMLWMFGVVAVGYATKKYLVFLLAIALGAIAAIGYPSSVFGDFTGQAYIFTSSWLLIIAMILSVACGNYFRRQLKNK